MGDWLKAPVSSADALYLTSTIARDILTAHVFAGRQAMVDTPLCQRGLPGQLTGDFVHRTPEFRTRQAFLSHG